MLAQFVAALRDELGLDVDAGTVALVALVAVLGLVVAAMLRFRPTRLFLGRFVAGLPLDGQRRTNAEWFASATKRLELFQDTRPSAWHYKPYALRALIRWAVTAWILALVTGFTLSSWVLLGVAVGAVVVWALIRWRTQVGKASVWAWEHRPHVPARLALGAGRRGAGDALALEAAPGSQLVPADEGQADEDMPADEDVASAVHPDRDLIKEIRDPVWDGARIALELSERAKADKYVILPESVDTDDAVLTIKLPRPWQGHEEQKKLLDHAVMSRLPGAWESKFSLMGEVHTAKYNRVARPPSMVKYRHAKKLIEAESSATSPVFGVGPRDVPVASDFKSEAPHVLLSMGSNAGKSSAIKAIVVPLLMEGAQLYIIDPKFNSHLWAKGLPNVHIASRQADMFDAIVWLGEETEERQMQIADDPNYQPPLRVVVLEEMNLLGRKIRRHWRQTMPKGAKASENPAFEAMADLSAAGRSASCHLVAVAQMLTTHTMGPEGNTTRENFSTRILGRYTRNSWKMLVPEVSPMPASSMTRGRVQVVSGGSATETQIIYYTDDEARAAALSGLVAQCPVPPVSVDAIPSPTREESRPVSAGRDTRDTPAAPYAGGTPDWIVEIDQGPHGRVKNDGETPENPPQPFVMGPSDEEEPPVSFRPVGPKEAHEEGIFGSASLDSARKALNRAVDRGEIKPVEEIQKGSRIERKYDPVELADWWDARTSAKN